MAKNYHPQEIEKKWQERWWEKGIYEVDLDKAKKPFFNLMMFPYPSAEGLHVGNMYAFTGADIYSRFQRMQGKDVFEPIGLDGFGIHSENYALQIGEHPQKVAARTEKTFYRQLHQIGNGFAWKNTLETYDPEYYKWTQWIFIQLYKAGLVERKKASVNWCPSCKTTLSDEQVIAGLCERCRTEVEKKELEQWFFKITKYAPKLLNNLDWIDWSERTKIAQRNWIGKSEGALIEFPVSSFQFSIPTFTTRPDTIFGATFFVLAPESEWVAKLTKPKHRKVVSDYVEQARKKTEVQRLFTEKEKTGVFTGSYVINPATNKKIPVWVADYVVMGYGTGAIMGVPAHDQRDWEFAKEHKIPIKPVIKHVFKQSMRDKDHEELLVRLLDLSKKNKQKLIIGGGWAADIHVGYRVRNHEDLDLYVPYKDVIWWKEEMGKQGFMQKILDPKKDERYYVEMSKEDNHPHYLWVDFVGIGTDKNGNIFDMEKGKKGVWKFTEKEAILKGNFKGRNLFYFAPEVKKWFTFKMRDKDVIDLASTGLAAYEEEGKLINSGQFNGLLVKEGIKEITAWLKEKGVAKKQTQYRLRDWCISRQRYWGPPIPMINCSKCGWQPVPEKDLPVKLPYIENYQPKGVGKSPLAQAKDWVKTKCPKCKGPANRETDVSDTFLDSAWYFFRYTSTDKKDVAFDKKRIKKWLPVDMYIGGHEHAVLHLMYTRFLTMVFKDLGLINFEEPFKRFYAHGLLISEGAKMSKSKGNLVIPDEYIKKFGADTLRCYLMFLGPFDQGGDFRDRGIAGMYRFFSRVWKIAQKFSAKGGPEEKKVIHQTIKKVTENIQNLRYNTAIAAIMEYVNFLTRTSNKQQRTKGISREAIETLVLLLAPFAPHISEEIWSQVLKNKFSVHQQNWPKYDPRLIKEKRVTIVIQVNGKLRGQIEVSDQASVISDQVEKLAKKEKNVAKYLKGKKIKKVVFISGRLINFVV